MSVGFEARPNGLSMISCYALCQGVAGGGSSVDPVIAAIAAGAAAGLTSTASQAVRDAYGALRSLLLDRFPQVDLRPLEELPDSRFKQDSLAEDLSRFGASRDADVVRLAQALAEAIAREAPHAAATVGVDLEHIRGEFLTIQRIEGGVRARDVETSGGIGITEVRAPGGLDPNR